MIDLYFHDKERRNGKEIRIQIDKKNYKTQINCHAVNKIAANATAENQASQHFYLKSIIMSIGWNSPTQKEGKPSLTFNSQSSIKSTKVHST